ncbi:ABC transporter ATP-binding protein [Ruania zhangjianzhongii]|uniref:ABC transporter ATP-binding protein n=1 Tax=Ruania zhangjianzhongii TaxID=2603206 RepID=UPI0011D19297|nr:ABC transporter ATP-binding protein [Ruania zhangjianzhongii]
MSTQHELRVQQISLSYDTRAVVTDLDLTVPPGEITVIVGANGCGKSTLLRGMARLLKPVSGQVLLDGEAIHQLPARRVAQLLGILPQSPVAPESITVADLVARGRYPHQQWFRQWSAKDEAAVASALARTDTLHLADREVDSLSGGQRQRVWVAMALAQDTGVLLLDEPTTFLDVSHQLDVLDLLRAVNAERGTTVVMVLHDLNLAARYADHLVVMQHGRVLATGTPAEVVTPAVVQEAFTLTAQVIDDPVTGTPMVVPVSRTRRTTEEI